MKLIRMQEIKGKIILRSGLHIGAGDTEMRIGGTDQPVIKHPHTLEPYVPGSSLKGKVRSLLEMRTGLMGRTKGEPLQPYHLEGLSGEVAEEAKRIIQLFGSSGADGEAIAEFGPTRASFADCPLTENWRQKMARERLDPFEIKAENTINRIQGVARDPRFTERVPADTEFDLHITLKIFDIDTEALLTTLLVGLKMLELDALGGNGSRGYGRVRFELADGHGRQRYAAVDPFVAGE